MLNQLEDKRSVTDFWEKGIISVKDFCLLFYLNYTPDVTRLSETGPRCNVIKKGKVILQ